MVALRAMTGRPREQGEPQVDLDPGEGVTDRDLERLGLGVVIGVRGRKTVQGGFAGHRPMGSIGKCERCRTVRGRGDQGGHAEIAGARRWVRQGNRGTDTVREAIEGIRPEMAIRAPRGQRRTEMQVPEGAILVDAKDEADPLVDDMELPIVRAPLDRHGARSTVSRVQPQR